MVLTSQGSRKDTKRYRSLAPHGLSVNIGRKTEDKSVLKIKSKEVRKCFSYS